MSNLTLPPGYWEIDTTGHKINFRKMGPDDKYTKQTQLWWPEANLDKIGKAVNAWNGLASSLDYVADQLDRQVEFLTTSWSGEAQSRFNQMWARWTSPVPITFPATPTTGTVHQKGHLREAADNCRGLAQALSNYATQVDSYRRQLLAMIAGTAVAVVAGIGLTVVTAGASDAAAAEAGAGLAYTASQLGLQMSAQVALVLGRLSVAAYYGFLVGMLADVAGHITYNEVLQPLSDPLAGVTIQEMVYAGVAGAATAGLFEALSLGTTSAGLPEGDDPWGMKSGESPTDFGTRVGNEYSNTGARAGYRAWEYIAANVNVSDLTQAEAVDAIVAFTKSQSWDCIIFHDGNDIIVSSILPMQNAPIMIVQPDGLAIEGVGHLTVPPYPGEPSLDNIRPFEGPVVP